MARNDYAEVLTLDTTYTIQILDEEAGEWNWYSQVEYTNIDAAHELGREIYGGEIKYRVIRIERHIES